MAAWLRPDPLGELKRSPRSLSRYGGGEVTISSRSVEPIAGKGEGIWKCVEWAEMNERGLSKHDNVSDFKFRSKCMLGSELRKDPIGRA